MILHRVPKLFARIVKGRTAELNVERCALVNIDVQTCFCASGRPAHSKISYPGNEQTFDVAHGIEQVSNRFRQAGGKVWWVYFVSDNEDKNMPQQCGGGFFGVKPRAQDEFVPKKDNSAFKDVYSRQTGFADRLRAAGVTTLAVTGVNAGACVMASVTDALHNGFSVVVLSDMVANNNWIASPADFNVKQMRAAGVEIMRAEAFLKAVQQANAPRKQKRHELVLMR